MHMQYIYVCVHRAKALPLPLNTVERIETDTRRREKMKAEQGFGSYLYLSPPHHGNRIHQLFMRLRVPINLREGKRRLTASQDAAK